MLLERWDAADTDVENTIQFLNQSFGGGWDRAHFDWYLARPFDDCTPDRLRISDGDTPAAGSVVNYRKIRLADDTVHRIGIASGSWTLPDFRGRGLFTRMMQASVERAGSKNCSYFLAFVTEDNASCNALARLGAEMIPATYLLSNETCAGVAADYTDEVAPVSITPEELFASQNAFNGTAFYYPTADIWAEQFLARPNPVEILRVSDANYAIVEKTADTDRLQWTSAPAAGRLALGEMLAERAAATKRKFFMYGTGSLVDIPCSTATLPAKPGFIACLPTGTSARNVDPQWDVQSGDRM
ncbi:MAG: GNAT family N-acetyltransferase [Gammaproteobacteria bacterium]|nr:GNAT family N-acetyltransferase [Gammaproteobacteria bacterium]NNC76340.1 GNAT family N-acetyltransferase [Woeseiaceae bacterium]